MKTKIRPYSIFGCIRKMPIVKMLLMMMVLLFAMGSGRTVFAQEISNAEETKPGTSETQAGWFRTEKGNYFWRNEDGTILKSGGWKVLDGKKYYLSPSGIRKTGLLKIQGKKYYLNPSVTTGFKTIDGKTYYFDPKTGAATLDWKKVKGKIYYFGKYGVMVRSRWAKRDGQSYYLGKNGVQYTGPGRFKINGYYYCLTKRGYRVSGIHTIDGKKYYFGANGRMVVDKQDYKIGNNYYTIDKKGNLTRVDSVKIECAKVTREFIKKRTNSRMTNAQKFRACFNYIMAYTDFRPSINPTNAEFLTQTWPHQAALDMLENGMAGSCYGIASLIASCAKELGYEPYVVAAWEDHAFVIIDGLYYDNMGPLFGSSYHSSYSKRSMVKF